MMDVASFFLFDRLLTPFLKWLNTQLSVPIDITYILALVVFVFGILTLLLPKQKDQTKVSIKNTCRLFFFLCLSIFAATITFFHREAIFV